MFLSVFLMMSSYGQSHFTFKVNAWDGNFTLPVSNACDYNYVMEGNPTYNGSGRHNGGTFSRNITVPSAGTYTVEIIPDSNIIIDGYSGFNSSQRDKFLELTQWGNAPISVENSGFYDFRFFQITATDLPKFAGSLYGLFFGCISIIDIPSIEIWDMSQVTDFTNLFRYAENFNGDISRWNISNVASMKNMFDSAYSFNQDLSKWNTENVQDMSYMFYHAKTFNGNISTWNTANVTQMVFMFNDAISFNQDISQWNTSNVENMSGMFYNATSFNQDISAWNTTKVKSMYNILSNAKTFNQNLGNWDLSSTSNISLDNSGMDCMNYGKTLLGWSTKAKDNVSLSSENLKYGIDTDTYRNILLSKGWEIIGDTLDASCSGSLGVHDKNRQKNRIEVYPNPTTELIRVKANQPIKQIQVYTTTGQLVISEQKTEVNLANKPSGIYLVRVVMQDGSIGQEKVIKK